ncbi:hypothetical protein K9N50_10720 [bacterium]|nr:hypothetical protein [bacterium]
MIEETFRDKFLKTSPLYPFTKDSVIGMGWKDLWRKPWLAVIIAVILMMLPLIFIIGD